MTVSCTGCIYPDKVARIFVSYHPSGKVRMHAWCADCERTGLLWVKRLGSASTTLTEGEYLELAEILEVMES